MVRMTPAQYNAWVRQENTRRKRAIDAHNAEARRVNAHNQRAAAHNNQVIADYNRRARVHNDRLKREMAKLNATTTTSRHVVYQRSVVTLRQSFSELEVAASQPTWTGAHDLVDLSESETANSVAALNPLLEHPSGQPIPIDPDQVAALRSSVITDELLAFGEDLQARWSGALLALHPDNPDASRHFWASARELMSSFLESVAPDAEVVAAARATAGSQTRLRKLPRRTGPPPGAVKTSDLRPGRHHAAR